MTNPWLPSCRVPVLWIKVSLAAVLSRHINPESANHRHRRFTNNFHTYLGTACKLVFLSSVTPRPKHSNRRLPRPKIKA
ncbi:uncharacterized protein F4807DRAFT_338843 [Annulohypoxylon truncatum]|uniref:uncharacterized protein n=1 Tax=Annulohypoxylon truncatum TaxID=327061 RepID=UPI0020075153|nr:uncharacterized protein F4807DRAFT_338843 [Annulohypoxylon truncatum]KAI1204345.1 hypothetical protein F4807DRAFT_338843 [Annulohypoxylon truncatum]